MQQSTPFLTFGNVNKSNRGDLVFYNKYVNLCNMKGVSPSAAAEEMGYQRSVVTRWSKGTEPREATIQRVADYFGVDADYLRGKKENPQIRQDQEVSESFKELLGMMKDAPEDDLRLLIKMYQAIRSERNNG